MPDAKMTVKQLRYDLIHRERLAQHFAELLPERDDA